MVAQGNVGLAFGLVAASGMATCLGACIVWCTSLAQPRLLAGSLGFAAGVMLFVSFAEIFMRKSLAAWEEVTASDAASYRWAMLTFFGGMLIIAVLDKLVHVLVFWSDRRSKQRVSSASSANLLACEDRSTWRRRWRHKRGPRRQQQQQQQEGGGGGTTTPPAVAAMDKSAAGGGGAGTAATPAPGTPRTRAAGGGAAAAGAAAAAAADVEAGGAACSSAASDDDSGSISTQPPDLSAPGPLQDPCDSVTGAVVAATSPGVVHAGPGHGRSGERDGADPAAVTSHSRTPPAVVEIMEADHHSFMLKKMGLLTALAIFIHNFPEGLATFVGALADTSVGVGLAVAIAMHNIPEGICVAMPIYYATGSRWKGFWWAFMSGVSEPLGGLVGYLVLGNGDTSLSFAVVFGLVAGMMVYISIKELIPTALRYDPQDSVATTCVVAGMVVMGLSLVLFTL